MKKLIIFILTLVLILFSSLNVYASQSLGISFESENAECDNNRLVNINIYAKSDKSLSAATFEFTFDRDILEFRNVYSDNADTEVRYYDTGDSVRVHYLNTWGEDISQKPVIFTITLKSVAKGTSTFKYSVSDCVDSDVNRISTVNCEFSSITIGKASEYESEAEGDKYDSTNIKQSNNDNEKETNDNSKNTEEISNVVEYKNHGLLNSYENDSSLFIAIGAAISATTFGIIILTVEFIKKIKSGKSKTEKSTSENKKEDKEIKNS